MIPVSEKRLVTPGESCATQTPVRLVLLDVTLCATSLLLSMGQLFQEDLQLAG